MISYFNGGTLFDFDEDYWYNILNIEFRVLN